MSEAALALAPWIAAQRTSLLAQRGHAWLLQGPSGLGQYALGLELVRAWLCDAPAEQGACGHCGSCHAIDVRTHADLCVLMPEVQMMALGWPLSEKAQADIDDKKRKPSREIRVEAMRDAVEFSQRTSARGKGKAVLVYPAEQMNHVTANALLKTLEEPPGDVRFVLASEAAHQLLPTLRSRCLGHTMVWPAEADSLAWLQAQGLARDAAASFLRAAGGRPEDALALAQSGRSPQAWSALPQAVARGDVTALGDWAPAQVIDALQKLCHDLLAASVGAAPRYFAPADLPKTPPLGALTRWSRALSKAARTADHPFNGGLMLEALVAQARNTLHSRHAAAPPPMSSPSTAPRPSVMQLAIKEKAALYAAYIPFFAEGGIFVPTQRDYKLGDDVYVLLTLPDDTQRYPVAGRVAWVTPARAAGNRTQGVGIQFPKDEKSRQLKAKIEELLGTALGSDRPTQTI